MDSICTGTKPNHLIVVCGHAIWLGGPDRGYNEAEWLLEPFQKGETVAFIEHIKDGVKALGQDDRAVLVFSGGPTRRETQLSEALSYKNLASANQFFEVFYPRMPENAFSTTEAYLIATNRVLIEDRALDSYYNILFSLILFWRAHEVWPEKLTIVSHKFKRKRMVDLHCATIRFPHDRIIFLGTDPPCLDLERRPEIMAGIRDAEDQWSADPHGVGEVLAGKRRKRNAWGVSQKLFFDANEKSKSRIATRLLEDGTEALKDGVGPTRRPWEA